VLSHEVAHALARHGAERLSEQKLVSVGLTAAAVALVAAGGRHSPGVPLSRLQESEADHIGLVLMAMAGYDPREAVALWERMREASVGKPRQDEWLSTHPADDTRLANTRALVPEAMKYYRPRN
jgi:predicted Zn-dependent protease